MKLSKAQEKMTRILYESDCVVHILMPTRGANYSSAFYGHECGKQVNPRPRTVLVLRDRRILEKVRGPYGSWPGDTVFNYGIEGQYALTEEGRRIAEELTNKETR